MSSPTLTPPPYFSRLSTLKNSKGLTEIENVSYFIRLKLLATVGVLSFPFLLFSFFIYILLLIVCKFPLTSCLQNQNVFTVKFPVRVVFWPSKHTSEEKKMCAHRHLYVQPLKGSWCLSRSQCPKMFSQILNPNARVTRGITVPFTFRSLVATISQKYDPTLQSIYKC